MVGNVILYDRIWLGQYIEDLERQINLLRLIKHSLQEGKSGTLPELKMHVDNLLQRVAELERSLETTEAALRDYLNKVRGAAIRFQKQCQEIQLPAFYSEKLETDRYIYRK